MASLQFSALILGLLPLFLLISSSHCLTCTSQNFTNKVYTNCTDLPSLSSYLHWTYDSTKSSLSIAFIAPPAKSDGWIAWAINPNGTGMVGAQALVALKESNGSMAVKTFDLSSYKSIVESKLSFNVSDTSAESSGGVMRIFATLTLPKDTTTVNQVWQVGGSVTSGFPDKHEFQPANLQSKGTLELTAAQSNGTTTGNSTTPATSNTNTTTTAGQSGNDASRISKSNVGFYVILLFLGIICF